MADEAGDDSLWLALTGRPTLPAGIGPHEGREIEMLLAGTKRVALFSDTMPECGVIPHGDFAPHLATGRLIAADSIFEDRNGQRLRLVVLAVPAARPEMDALHTLMREIHTDRRPFTEAADRQIGQWLGYSAAEIERFIIWQRRRRR